EAFAGRLDQAEAAVDELRLVAARVRGGVDHEALERVALAIDLCDRLGPLRLEPAVDLAVVVVGVDAHLVLVRPVHLPVGREVIVGVALECGGLVRVREKEEVGPTPFRKLLLRGGDRRRIGYRPVAGEDAAAKEAVRALVDRVLKIAVEKTVADAAGESRGQLRDVAHLDHALELAPRYEAQRHRIDEAEQAVAADGEAEELRVLGAAAVPEIATRVEQLERFDVAHERRK